MKKLLLISIFLAFTCYFEMNAQNQKHTSNTVLSTISKDRPADFMYLSAPDSTGYRRPLKTPKISDVQRRTNGISELPYPIIFIHGLNSNFETWLEMSEWMDSQFDLSYGGRLDYCLDYDNSLYTANTNIYNSDGDGSDIVRFEYSLNPYGDYYFLNFDIGNDGSYAPIIGSNENVYSNQAAIVKQGVAVRDAIEVILNETGKSKVILFGHSMGGLAAREYLQNSVNWQNDGEHHVAKLITTGSPHGGSNFSFGTLSLLAGANESSDAVRDLRSSYFWSGQDGVFLKGGLESSSVMWDSLIFSFFNLDVNCDGTISQNIIGLNEKENPTDLDYSCIIGESDIVVSEQDANLFNFIQLNSNFPQNLFYSTAGHLGLTNQTFQNMQGLDEPNEYSLSYEIDLNKNYIGFVTPQPEGGYDSDYDDFKFTITENGIYELKATNTTFNNLNYYIIDSEFNILFSDMISEEFNSDYSAQISLNSGQYFIEFESNSPSSLSTYNFSIETTLSNNDNVLENIVSVYPNPTNSITNIDSTEIFNQAEVYNVFGQKIVSKLLDLNQRLDLSELSAGFYNVVLKNNQQIKTIKIIKK
jgi:pimeloyl-ACP methyl ester carboxylesterase